MSNPLDYTVGWICAITTEFIAAQAFLDEKHEDPDAVAPNDNNVYALGRMGKHNIVIAVLPKSSYGTTSAAVVARDLVQSFPNVRIGLMVGIGGGAPSLMHDIRLGDVVVGCPSIREGGVIQYDFGKMIQNQAFAETTHLNQPPQLLLTAVGALEAKYALEGNEINDAVESALEQRPRLRKTHSRPPTDSDKLYASDYVHPVQSTASCSEVCDPDRVVVRRQREDDDESQPAIHHGLIASANRVMKDALKRDEMAAQRSVLCFEMEAAGLVNHFPCLVIRGICDYSDTHKNKAWQGFAAMTAAAYAKDLLKQIAPTKVEAETKITDVLQSIEQSQLQHTQALNETKAVIEDVRTGAHLNRIKKWLNPPDVSVNLNHARQLRHQGTGLWIFNSWTFQQWGIGIRQHLWLYGLPGCGKTVLSTTIHDALVIQGIRVVLQFFFDFGDGQKQTVDHLVRSLIFQLYTVTVGTQNLEILQKLDSLLSSSTNGSSQPTMTELSNCFASMLEAADDVCIIIDALDECSNRKELLTWITYLACSPCLRHIKFLITSRPEEEFRQRIPLITGVDNCKSLDVAHVNADICSYVQSRIRTSPGFRRWASRPLVLQQICDQVGQKADGMFRWAACQLDCLEECLSLEEIEATLRSLPKDLNETYGRIVDRIPQNRKMKATRLLQFLIHSSRPLLLEEAVDLLAVKPQGFDQEYRLPDPKEILRYCPSLVSVVVEMSWNKRLRKLQLAHFSVKEYLLNSGRKEFGPYDTGIAITRTLLAYLKSSSGIPYPKSLSEFPLLRKAAYWTEFARLSDDSRDVIEPAVTFLQNERLFHFWEKLDEDTRRKEDKNGTLLPWPKETLRKDALSLACAYGLRNIVKSLLACGGYLDTPHRAMTALQACSFSGLCDIAELILNMGFDVNTEGSYCVVAYAASHGREDMVKLFLNRGANVNLHKTTYQFTTPVVEASRYGYQDILQTLLETGADVDWDGREGALHEASYFGHERVVQLLLAYGADVNAKKACGSALLSATRGNHVEVARLLLQAGADVNSSSATNDTPLINSIRNGNVAIVKLLLERGVRTRPPNRQLLGHSTDTAHNAWALKRLSRRDDPLREAAEYDQLEILQLIIRHEKMNEKREKQDCLEALKETIRNGNFEATKTMLEYGADANAEIENYGSVIIYACLLHQQEIVRLLWEFGADISVTVPTNAWGMLLPRRDTGVTAFEISHYARMTVLEIAQHDGMAKLVNLFTHSKEVSRPLPIMQSQGSDSMNF
ncbi:ankyrin repeat protein [Colletotrichum truncatum]|uniref:Ankyrin repeat protein n=1 Tax=Colletotrichum truncatum TaxID=5467 RepID=A0ACC3Z2A6_COLTU|nr:ankyrin repeat protein [Colletotrichum truncatum]KAF6786512.1 ankyrin repeat protein [Colletotrichum truncatum]